MCLTESEALVWSALKARQLGVKFRPEVPLAGRFIVDFFASASGLIVEVDGGYHSRRRRADASRARKLQRLGYRAVRLEAELILRDLAAAVALVRAALWQSFAAHARLSGVPCSRVQRPLSGRTRGAARRSREYRRVPAPHIGGQ